MKSAFFEYQVAMSGLFTARGNLNVISHNLANAAIPGYSRQVTKQGASRPLTLYDGKGMYGTGSEIFGINQIRDVYLDRKYWSQRGVMGEYTTKNSHLALVETIFNDLSGSGVSTAFTSFFSRLQDLTTNTPDSTYRANVVSACETLAEIVNSNAEALQKQQRDLNQELEGIVERVNSLGDQICSLNRQIYQYETDGSNANDLRDQRALLVDALSEYVNVSVEERDYGNEKIPHDKRFVVLINGYDFVNHFNSQQLACVPRDIVDGDGNPAEVIIDGNKYISGVSNNVMDVPNLYDLAFVSTGAVFDIHSKTLQGTLKGLVDIRDGNNDNVTAQKPLDSNADGVIDNADKSDTDGNSVIDIKDGYTDTSDIYTTTYKGIPYYMNKLNTLVRTFARAMNEGLDINGTPISDGAGGSIIGHMDGYDAYCLDASHPNGNPVGAQSGLLLFTAVIGRNDQLAGQQPPAVAPGAGGAIDYNAIDCLNFAVNPQLVEDPKLLACNATATVGESNNDVIHGFNKVNTYPSLFREGKLQDFIIGTTDHLAIDRNQAKKFDASYTEITMATDNQRLSVSGVNTNEEIMAFIKYNQLFQSCAKLVNVIDQVYDTLINRLGAF